jgi:hypothetical protein
MACFPASGLLKSTLMQALVSGSKRWIKPVFAGLMAAFVFVLALFASNEKLHLKLHEDSNAPHQSSCAVCTIAQGQVDLAPAISSQFAVPLSVSWTLPGYQATFKEDADFSVASSRGPPAAVSSL